MKPKNTLRSFLALAGSSLLAISSASANTYYWDSNNASSGFGTAAGTWAAPTVGTATAGWSLNPAGTDVTLGVDVTTATTDDLYFGSGFGTLGYAGTITVSGTVDAGNLTTFSNRAINGTNHINLSGGTAINLAATSTINTVADDNILTIGTALTGAGTSLTKTGIGTLVLGSSSNTFAGQLTVAQGVLSIAAINNNSTNGTLGNSASAVILGSSGYNGVLRYTGGNAASDKAFTLANGGTGAFDVTTGNTLTLNGAISGGGRLYKTGIGTILTTVSNGYSGGTVVGAGTLSLGAASSLGTDVNTNNINIQNSGRLLLDESTNIGATQSITLSSSSNNAAPVSTTGGAAKAGGALAVLGLNYNGLPASISQANTNGGVIAINAVTGYDQNLSTLLTSKNLFLGAIGTSTFTGAAGTVVAGTGDLYRLGGGGGTITFSTPSLFTGAKGVQVGSTSVNGTGTVVISEAQDYSLATTVSGGTLTLSGANGSATGSTGFTLNGGRLFLDSSGTNNTDRIGTVAVNLSNGGEIHLNGNAAGTTETIGNLSLVAGYSTVTAQATTVSSTLAANAFSRTNNGTALFRGTALGQNAAVQGQVTLSDTTGLSFVGTTTLNNAADGDTSKDVKIIPYLVGDTGTSTGNTFVTYDDTTGFRVLNTTNQFTVNAFNTGENTRLTSAQTGITSATINSLILSNSGTSTIADGATLTVTSGAILVQGGNGTINQAGTTGILDFGSNTGYLTTINTLAIGAQITGSGGLVKSGSGELSLTNVNNSFTGDLIINGGTLRTGGGGASTNGLLGDAANNIVVNGNANWIVAPNQTYTRGITINNGAILSFSNNGTTTFTRDITGSGGINVAGGFSNGMVFSGTGNAFEGPILLAGTGNNNYETRVTFATLADSTTANGRIVFSTNNASRAAGSRFEYTGTTDLLLANRQIELASTINSPTFGHQIRSSGAGTLSISTDLIVSTPIAQTLHLNGTNTGTNTFSGKIVDGDGKVSLTKSEAGRWILSGANTYTGNTTITGGTLELADNAQLKFVLGATSGTNNNLTGTAGTVVLDGDFVIDTSAADALASGTWTLENVSTLAGPYGTTFTVVGFTDEGDDTWTKDIGGGKTYTFDETTGILTLATGGGDVTAPLLTSMTDNVSGGPITVGTLVTYTVTFNEDIDDASVTAADFDNDGTAAVTIGTVTETTPTSGVFTVQATPTSAGTMKLRIPAGAVVEDTSGNDLVVPVSDDTTITVQTQYDAWSGGAAFDADANGDGVKNGLAFLLGAANPNASALGLLPTVTQSGGNLVLTFSMLNAASRGSASLAVEHSSNLGISDPWAAATVPNTSGVVSGVTFTVTPGSPSNGIVASIPSSEAASGKLFGRLKANNP